MVAWMLRSCLALLLCCTYAHNWTSAIVRRRLTLRNSFVWARQTKPEDGQGVLGNAGCFTSHLFCKRELQQHVCWQEAFLEKHNVKLGFMSAFVKAAADALMMVPAVNAVIDGEDIVYRDYVDISIAVATPKGLVVPVLRDCNTMSYADIEKVKHSSRFRVASAN